MRQGWFRNFFATASSVWTFWLRIADVSRRVSQAINPDALLTFTIVSCKVVASHADALRARHAFLPHRLHNWPVNSVRWRLAFLYCKTFAFEGQNVGNKKFSVKCCLLAFCIVAQGPAVSLDLFASRAHVSKNHPLNLILPETLATERLYQG